MTFNKHKHVTIMGVTKIYLKYINFDTMEYDGKTLYQHDAYSYYMYYPHTDSAPNDVLTGKLNREICESCKIYNDHTENVMDVSQMTNESIEKFIKVITSPEFSDDVDYINSCIPLNIPPSFMRPTNIIVMAQNISCDYKVSLDIRTLVAAIYLILNMQVMRYPQFNAIQHTAIKKIKELIAAKELNEVWSYPLCNIYILNQINSYNNDPLLDNLILLPKDKYLWYLILQILPKKILTSYLDGDSDIFRESSVLCELYHIYTNLLNMYMNLLKYLNDPTEPNYISEVIKKYANIQDLLVDGMYNETHLTLRKYIYEKYYTDQILCFPDNIDFETIHTPQYIKSNLDRIEINIRNILKLMEDNEINSYKQKKHYNMFHNLLMKCTNKRFNKS